MSPIAMREAWDELLWLGLHGKTMQTGAYSSLGMNCHASFMPREENQMPDFKFPDGVREIRNVMGWILLCRPGRRIHVTRIPQEKKDFDVSIRTELPPHVAWFRICRIQYGPNRPTVS
jgi:DNA-binding NtrC family response regulator